MGGRGEEAGGLPTRRAGTTGTATGTGTRPQPRQGSGQAERPAEGGGAGARERARPRAAAARRHPGPANPEANARPRAGPGRRARHHRRELPGGAEARAPAPQRTGTRAGPPGARPGSKDERRARHSGPGRAREEAGGGESLPGGTSATQGAASSRAEKEAEAEDRDKGAPEPPAVSRARARPEGRSALLVPCEGPFTRVLGSLAPGKFSPGLRGPGQGKLRAKSLALVWNRKTWKEQGDPEGEGKQGTTVKEGGSGRAGVGARGDSGANGVMEAGWAVCLSQKGPALFPPGPASLAPAGSSSPG